MSVILGIMVLALSVTGLVLQDCREEEEAPVGGGSVPMTEKKGEP